MNINISGEVVRTSQLPKRIIGLGDYLVALNSSPLETSTVLVSDFVSFLNTQFATSLASLTDVSINGPLPGQALVFNGSYWVNQNLVSSLAGLSDVTIASLNPNQLLRYDGTSWKNWTPTFYSLPAGGTTLQYIDGTGALQTLPTTLPTSTVKHLVKAGVPITKGQAVYVTSADGTNMIVGLASNASEATSSKTMGLLDATVTTNGFANVVTEGLLAGLDTTGANAAGDPVWLGTNGNLIYGLVNKPYAPNHLVFIGIVTRRNANNGEIFVKVQNGFELDELHNVDARNPNNNDGIFYNSVSQLWEHKQISSVFPTPTLDSVTTAGNTTTNNITVGTLYFGNGNHYLVTDNSTYAMLSSNRTLQLSTSGNPVLSVFTTQNVAIGTTTDAGYKLDVNGTIRFQDHLIFSSTKGIYASTALSTVLQSSTNYFTHNRIASSGTLGYQIAVVGNVQSFWRYNDGTGDVEFGNANGSYHLGLYAGNTERVKILGNGNVGIGTVSPSYKLDVTGDVRFQKSNGANLYLSETGGNAGDVAGLYLTGNNSTWGGSIRYNVGPGGAINRLDLYHSLGSIGLSLVSNGNVAIGTTTDLARLTVRGSGSTSATNALLIQNSSGTTALTVRDDSKTLIGVGSGSLILGTSSANTNAISLVGYFSNGTNCGFYIQNQNSGTIKTQLGSATYGVYIDLTQTFSNGASRGGLGMTVTGTINNTGTSAGDVGGYSFEPVITSLTGGSVIYAFNSTVGGAYINTSSRQASAILQADSTTQGFLPPRLTSAQRTAISSPAAGLCVFDTDLQNLCFFRDGVWVQVSFAAI